MNFKPLTDKQLALLPQSSELNFFDTHNHLARSDFDADRDAVIKRAKAAGVHKMLLIGAGDGESGNLQAIALATPELGRYASIGIHPHEANLWQASLTTRLQDLYAEHRPCIVAWGEIGLDYHYHFAEPAVQRKVFSEQLAIAAQLQLPFIVHTRQAHRDTLAILQEHRPTIKRSGGIIHCFSEGPDEAQTYLDLGLHLSFSGIVTFAKSLAVQEAARLTPDQQLLIETDAPYLAPTPLRSFRNEPACVTLTARFLAQLRQQTPVSVASLTSQNALELFRIT